MFTWSGCKPPREVGDYSDDFRHYHDEAAERTPKGVGTLVTPHSKIPTLFPPNPSPIQPPIPCFRTPDPASTGNRVHAYRKVRYNRVFSKNTRFKDCLILQNSGLLLAAKNDTMDGSSGARIGQPDGTMGRFPENRHLLISGKTWQVK